MGRAARRQQERAARRQARQERRGTPSGPSLSTSTPTVQDGPRTGGSLLKPRWASDIISELKKVTWPTRQETAHLTLVVIVVSALVGTVLGAADLGFNWFVEHTILN